MKKLLSYLCILVLAFVMMTMPLTAGAETGSVIELDFWNGFTGSDGAILEEIVKKFNEKYVDQYKVNMDIMAWDVFYQKFNPSIATGTAPNFVIASQNRIPMYADNGTYQTVSDIFTDYDVDKSNILNAQLVPCQYKDEFYALPMFNGFLSLWYNKDMLAAAGYDAPPTTIDELIECAKKMTDPLAGKYGFSVETSWISPSLLIWPWNNGGDAIVDGKAVFNSDANVEVFTKVQKAVLEDGISPIGIGFDESLSMFLAGKLGMFYCGPWILQDVLNSGLNYGVSGFPGDVQYGYTSCFGVTTANTDEERDGCMKFLEFYYSDEIQLLWSVKSGFPTYTLSVMEMDEYKSNDVQASIAPFLDKARIFMVEAPNADLIYNDILWPAFQQIIIGGEDVKTVLDAANVKLESWIVENMK